MTEVLDDVVLGIPPLGPDEADELLDLIRCRALLGRFRGQPQVNRDLIVTIIRAVARIAADHPCITEIDLNPVIVRDDSPVVADALIVLSSGSHGEKATRARVPGLDAVLAPASIAVVGASDDVTRWGGSALRNIIDGGFRGQIYPVSPRGGEFFGLPVYESLDALPEAPDLALLVVGAAQLGDVLDECGRRGVRGAVAIAAGFSETGEEGARAEGELAARADTAGVALIGPNCLGLITNAVGLHATGFITLHPRAGALGIVSQSGSLGVQLTSLADRRDIGVRCFVGVGNEAQVTALDVVDYLAADEGTRCVLAYLEGVDDGRRLVETVARTSRRKPVVVLRGGLTDQGGRAAASHTGALAGSAAMYAAAARQSGLASCTAVQEALDLTTAFLHLPLPQGRRVAVVTNGGGPGVLAADEVARHGLALPEPSADLLDELDDILPFFWSRRNPFDMVATAGGDTGHRVLSAVARSSTFDAVIVLSVLGVPNTGFEVRHQGLSGEYAEFSPWEQDYLDCVADLIRDTGKPIINVPDLPMVHSVYAAAGSYRPVLLPTPRAAALVIDRMERYHHWRERNPA